MMTLQDLDAILKDIELPTEPPWMIRRMPKGDGFLIQIAFIVPDTDTGKDELQKCRKWYVSSHAAKSEVVRTVYKAGLAALEHEFQEQFKYRGEAIFNPHMDLEKLAKAGWLIGKDVRS